VTAIVFNFEKLTRPRPNYTAAGIERLQAVIRATLAINSWSTRQLAKRAGISHVTVAKYANGSLREPQEDILKALAPYIYRATFSQNNIEIASKTYQDDWEALCTIATDEFCSGSQGFPDQEGAMSDIARMIRECVNFRNLSQQEVEAQLHEMQKAKTAKMSVERLRQIQSGEHSALSDDEVRIIRVLVDPFEDSGIYRESEWLEAAGLREKNPPAQREQRADNGMSNGVK
jgi:transcriptional regulator with XRE-family HTH domain